MSILQLIRKKRDGGTLSTGEMRRLIEAAASGEMPDYQTAALLMAMFCRGLDIAETGAMTLAMRDSGAMLRWPEGLPVVDKHSTGGVGDGVSLIAGPIAASLGARTPMIAGRGLGHSGGTIDKLEAIPGFSTNPPLERFQAQVLDLGLAIVGQSAAVAPADGALYALRDVTATVEHKGLISASILSKKLAEGLRALVMDVKAGRGAFMESLDEARELGRWLARLGDETGLPVRVLLTAMDQPLGRAVGNAVEIAQAVEILSGRSDSLNRDLVELSLLVAARMLEAVDLCPPGGEALAKSREALADGRALAVFRSMVEAQGGDPGVIDDPARLPQARLRETLKAPTEGYVRSLDARPLGLAAVELGAGRARRDERVDPAVGLLLRKKVGDKVAQGEPLLELLANDEGRLARARKLCSGAFMIGGEPVAAPGVVLEEMDVAAAAREHADLSR